MSKEQIFIEEVLNRLKDFECFAQAQQKVFLDEYHTSSPKDPAITGLLNFWMMATNLLHTFADKWDRKFEVTKEIVVP